MDILFVCKRIGRIQKLLCLSGILVGFFFSLPLFSQSQSGFYDEFDRDLRGLPPGPGEDRFRIYQIPPKKKNHFPVNPKSVRRYYDPIAGFPGAGTGSLEQLGNQGVGRRQAAFANQRSFINPVTGEIDYSAAQTALYSQDQERARREKDQQRFREEEIYKESRFRRFQIIFFLTMPVALGVSAGVAGALGIERAVSGSVLMITGTLGLSGANAYQDLKKMEEYKREKGTEWHTDEEEESVSWR